MNEKIINVFERIKSDRKLLLIIFIGFLGILLLLFSEIFTEKDNTPETASVSERELDFKSYENNLEDRLKLLLESINGAGKVNVMITIESGDEMVYATETERSDKNEDKKYVLVDTDGNDDGLLLKVAQPEVRGVAVVCQGADSPEVKRQITDAVTSVLRISSNRVSISKMKPTNGG